MKNIGFATIELFQPRKGKENYNWCQIKYTPRSVLVGMYEGGEVARKLFTMNKEQTKQLANTLMTLAETMESDDE